MRKILLIVAAVIVLDVALIAYAPARIALGRHSPAMASFISPMFAFSYEYAEGYVIGFDVGSNKDVVFRYLRDHYAGAAQVIIKCQVTHVGSVVGVAGDTDIGSIYGGGNHLCVLIRSRLMLIFAFDQQDIVRSIEVSFSRIEGP
jgi:hypothetical protein